MLLTALILWALAFIFILFVLGFLLENWFNRLLGVEKKKISETPGKKFEKWGRGIFILFYVCTLPFMIREPSLLKWLLILYAVVALGFQSVLEWKYIKNSKQYITTLIIMVLVIIIIFGVEYLIQSLL
ncbi:hypothetical protein CWR48_06050 [Oceanobacillus arenosus]|uniref:DUF4181 domain-containing protein n=1 Tax=Oceanobacillus arenosus TaxID=1229153 RepID=A0A3D8PYL6_9BACI|nr:DUF4181 domain-containing protein [Oceanobacillus arenosus]RDW20259.1 hypothetical protein CWR48_06050 [Oceanobacillus arenosus]